MRTSLLLLAGALALTACREEATPPSLDFGAGDGISYRDASNVPSGTQDPTDWTTDATWNQQETALFTSLGLDLNPPGQSAGLLPATGAYPNPGRQATWTLARTTSVNPSYRVRAVLVNQQYGVLTEYGSIPLTGATYSITLDYGLLKLQPGQRYRLYYVAYEDKAVLLKGHGDVRYDQ